MVKTPCTWNCFCNLITILQCRSAILNLLMEKENRCDRGDLIITKIEKNSLFQNLTVHWSLKASSGCKPFKGATITWKLSMACCKERPQTRNIKIMFKVTEVKKVFTILALS